MNPRSLTSTASVSTDLRQAFQLNNSTDLGHVPSITPGSTQVETGAAKQFAQVFQASHAASNAATPTLPGSKLGLELDGSSTVPEPTAQEYVVLLQIMGTVHDASEWLAYTQNVFTFWSPAPTREDLSQFGTVVDTYDLDFAERYAKAQRTGVSVSHSSVNQFFSPGRFTLSSKNPTTAKVDLDPEYTVLTKDTNTLTPYALVRDRAATATPELAGKPTVWEYPRKTSQLDDSESASPTIMFLLALAIVLGVRKGLEMLLLARE